MSATPSGLSLIPLGFYRPVSPCILLHRISWHMLQQTREHFPSRKHVCVMFTALNPTFIQKTGVCRGIYLFFLVVLQNIDCGYSLESLYVLSKNKKNIKNILLKMFLFYHLKNLCIYIAWACFRNEMC